MRRLILLISLFLFSTVWIVAQSQSSENDTGTGTNAVGSDSQSTSGDDINQQSTGTSMAPQSEENNAQGASEMNAPANAPSGSEEGMTQNESSGGKTVEGNQASGESGTSGNEAMGTSSSSMQHGTMHNGTTSRVRTVSGCLSEENGQFTLTDKSGNTFQLTGKTAQLKAHVGHEIRVKGRESASESAMMEHGNEPGSMSGGQGAEQSLSVISFKHISSTCTANPAR